MGLKPLEYSDCLLDTPYFRDSIHDHEKELDQANYAIKSLIKECQNLIKALENLSKAQSSFGGMLESFKLRYIGEVDAEDELEYEDAFPIFSQNLAKVEEERERMLHHANIQLIEPLERFRKEQIGRAKEEKKKFDRETDRVCALLESHLKTSPKKKETMLQEADSQVDMELHKFREFSLDYVTKLQEVNETKKFELVEIILAYMYGQSTFYHNGHEVFQDHKNYMTDLSMKLQTSRENFKETQTAAEELKTKTKKKYANGELHKAGSYSRQGYLTVHDKKKSVLGPQWVKHYCMYTKENKILTMVPYTQTNSKLVANTETLIVTSCVRRPTESSERRFLFDITGQDRQQPLTMQCISEEDRRHWLEVMEGKEPIYMESSELKQNEGVTNIDDTGIQFVKKCMEGIERRGLTDQGIYRIAGVSSKYNKLLNTGIDPKQIEKLDLLSDDSPWEVKTITSAMKQYFRNLSEPIYTFKLHAEFLNAIKLDTNDKKVAKLKELVEKMPEDRAKILNRLMYHLKLVAGECKTNLMQESNIGVVLGPTLMRPKEETMAAIMSIKFQSLVVETMIREYDHIFVDGPPASLLHSDSSQQHSPKSITPSSPLMAVPESPTAPRSPSNRNSGKYRAPGPPLKKPQLSTQKSDIDLSQKPVVAERPRSATTDGPPPLRKMHSTPNSIKPKYPPPARPNLGSLKRWPPVAARPDAPRLGVVGENGETRFTEAITPFTSPAITEDESLESKHRRESYAMAMGKMVKSVDGLNLDTPEPKSPPPPPVSQKPSRQFEVPFQQRPPKPDVPPPSVPKRKEWKVRALYDCVAENSAELSFNKGAIISNVKSSTEEGWMIGMLNGKTGLVPENYCEKVE